MRDWFSSFDFAALILLIIIWIWFITEKRVPLKGHELFLRLIVLIVAATVLELATEFAWLYITPEESLLFEGLLILYSVAFNIILPTFAYYVSLLADYKKEKRRVIEYVCHGFMIVSSVILLLNPWLKWAYYYTEQGQYVETVGMYILNGINILSVLLGLCSILKIVTRLTFVKAATIFFTLILWALAWFARRDYDMNVLCFAMSICCATLYHYLHNPGRVIDAKTNLYNRNFMGHYVISLFSYEKGFSAILIAMDDFKFVNKTYGVDTGDELLAQIARFLKGINEKNVVFRFGSDQFCIILDKKSQPVEDVAEEIHARFLHPWYCNVVSGVMMSASLCCIDCPRDAATYGDLVEVIDYSMAIAKKNKKGGISHASEIELDRIHKDKAVEKAVRLAMDRDELMVYYQPIYSVNHNGYNSAEALVRLKDEELGWISPEVFIPLAEKNGLIVEMGDIILNKVCRFIQENNLKETSIEYIEINISPIQLIQADFANRVKAIMEKYEVQPSQLNMEITETATIASMSVVKDNINKLVDMGISFSLDDYGSGSANIDYINRMPFKIIKLDKYIIWDAFKNDKAGITLEYTIGMLNALKLLIVAEGVETEEMRDRLTSIGCHYMQGWYYSKAVSDKEFMNLMQKSAE